MQSFAGFAAMRAMVTDYNHDPLAASRPFDKKRAGFVMGEYVCERVFCLCICVYTCVRVCMCVYVCA